MMVKFAAKFLNGQTFTTPRTGRCILDIIFEDQVFKMLDHSRNILKGR